MRGTLGNEPWIACIATLDDDTFKTDCDHAAFRKTTSMKRYSIDRPDIALVHAVVKRRDKKSFKLLHFLVLDFLTLILPWRRRKRCPAEFA